MEKAVIKVLMENEAISSEFKFEHGLSLYIEANNYKILFDVGQSDAFIENAQLLNINLKDIDFVILSHGHYDHCGGLNSFLEINSKAKIVYKKEALESKWNAKKYIGINKDFVIPQNRTINPNDLYEVVPDVFVCTDIKINNEDDTHFNSLFIKTESEMRTDTFEDELFLVIKKDGQLNIITGCAHRGITNIIASALSKFGMKPIATTIGGFHLSKENEDVRKKVCSLIDEYSIKQLYPMHCTGIDSLKYLNKTVWRNLHAGDCISL